jgi:hypothetical protein
MAEKHELNRNLEDLTENEIYSTIAYLDPNPGSTSEENVDSSLVICLWIVLLACLGFMWVYCQFFRQY